MPGSVSARANRVRQHVPKVPVGWASAGLARLLRKSAAALTRPLAGRRRGAVGLLGESVAGRRPVDAAIDMVQEAGVAPGARQMTQRRVERAAAVVLLVPRKRMELAHALARLRGPVRLRLVGLLVDRQ